MGLNSTSTIKLVDLLCEGTIEGLVDGTKGIYFNETPLKATDGTYNFEADKVSYDFKLGGATQGKLEGYINDGSSTVTNINTEIGTNYSETLDANRRVTARDYGAGQVVRQITDTEVTSIHLLFTIPSLFLSLIHI